jgi:predicted AlkP superfamily pyrophosphatase or phosphodiesterase
VPVSRPVHLNRILRSHGLLVVREELGRELLDAGASTAFAVADHQVAHVYVNDLSRLEQVHGLLATTPGVARVLDDDGKRQHHLDHPRSGELVALAEPNAWFTYYYWADDDRAPDFARTVDIHRKPGYDPAELFLDPSLALPGVRIAAKLLRRKLGFRTLMDVIPLDATLVRGSHGLGLQTPDHGPIFMTSRPDLLETDAVLPTAVSNLILRHLHG